MNRIAIIVKRKAARAAIDFLVEALDEDNKRYTEVQTTAIKALTSTEEGVIFFIEELIIALDEAQNYAGENETSQLIVGVVGEPL